MKKGEPREQWVDGWNETRPIEDVKSRVKIMEKKNFVVLKVVLLSTVF